MRNHGGGSKRALDVVVALVLFIATLPVQLVAGAAVAIRMGWPVLFRQERAGLGGRPFRLAKLRTMRATDPARGLVTDAERLTALGRFLRATSIDELPTFWNVIRGDMSLVGPRPLPTAYLPRYSAEQARRHEVRPGITGLAQISGRNALSWDEKFRLDVEYVNSHTTRGDIVILMRTVTSVMSARGVAAPGSATMPEFAPNQVTEAVSGTPGSVASSPTSPKDSASLSEPPANAAGSGEVPATSATASPGGRGVGRAVSSLVGARLASVSLSMAAGVVLARSLGPAGRGELGVSVAMSGILAIALTAGLDVATLRSAGGGHLSAALQATARRTVIAVIASAALVPFALWSGIASHFDLGPLVLSLGLLLVPLIVVTQLLGNCVLGIGRHASWARATILNMIVYGAIVVAVAVSGASSPSAYLAALGAGYVASLTLLGATLRSSGVRTPATAEMTTELRKAALGTAPTTIIQLALLRLPVPLLALLAGTEAAGVLTVAMPLGEALLVIPVAAGTVLLPAYRAHGQDPARVRQHARATAAVSAGAGLALCLLAPVGIPFIYGQEFAGATQLVLIIAPGFVAFSYGRIFQSSLQADGLYRRVNLASVASLVVLILLHAALVPTLAATGSAAALSSSLIAMGIGLVIADGRRHRK